MHRRPFLGCVLGARSHLGFGCAGMRQAARRRAPPPREHLVRTLTRVADCIYPPGPASPGAWALGIDRYLERQIDTKYYRRHLGPLQRMAERLDARAQRDGADAFASAPAEARRRLVDQLARGELSDDAFDGLAAFDTMATITLEGCFADPRHGGNEDRMAWDTMSSALDMRWFDDCDCH